MHITESIHKDIGDTVLAIRRKKSQINANNIKIKTILSPIQKDIVTSNTKRLERQIESLKYEVNVFIGNLSIEIKSL